MIQELLYTSAPKGLKPGSRGFCTVLSTSGMPAPVATALESLSGYRPIFPPGDPQADQNPVVYSHYQMSLNGRRSHVLSRIADYGLDYSQRSNKLAHHLVLEPSERPSAGPAWVLAHSGMMRESWDGELKIISGERKVPDGPVSLRPCNAWKELAGDAGWAGVLAETFLKQPDQPAFIIFSPGMNLLPLMEEAISLLPANRRWDATFSTYFTKVPSGVTCNWRCLLADSPEAKESRRYVHALRIDLTKPLPPATGGELVEVARTGKRPESAMEQSVSSTTYSAHPPQLPLSSEGPDKPIRILRDRPVPPSIRNYVGSPPIRKTRFRFGRVMMWGTGLIMIAAIVAGAGFYRTGLKQKTLSETAQEKVVENLNASIPEKQVSREETSVVPPLPNLSDSGEQQSETGSKSPSSSQGALPLRSRQETAGDDSMLSKDSPKREMTRPKSEDSTTSSEIKATGTKEKPKEPNRFKQVRNPIRYWGELEKGLNPNSKTELVLDDVVANSVSVWVPTDLSEIVQSEEDGMVKQNFSKVGWHPYMKVSCQSSGQSKSTITVNANEQIPYEYLCRFVCLVGVDGLESPLTIIPYENVQYIYNSSEEGKVCRHKLLFPTTIQNVNSGWNIALNSLQFSGEQINDLVPRDKIFSLQQSDNKYVGQIDLKINDLIIIEIQQDDEAKLGSLKDSDISVKISVRNSPETSVGRPVTEVCVDIVIEEFQRTLKKYVETDIVDASFRGPDVSKNVPAQIRLNLKWRKDSNLVTSKDLLDEVISLIKKSEDMQQQNTVEVKPKDEYTEQEKGKLILFDAAKLQLERLNRIKKYCEFFNELSRRLRSVRLQNLQISQECQYGGDKKFLPIFIYQSEQSSSESASN